MDQEHKSFYTVSETAEILQVSDRTVRNMIDSGTLEGDKIDPSKERSTWRIKKASLDDYLSKRNE